MEENELRDALLRGHESLYASSPTFRTNLDTLAALLPLWVAGMASRAQQDLGEEYARYTALMRDTSPISLEEWEQKEEVARRAQENLDQERRAMWLPKPDWRERAKERGVFDRVKERIEELSKEEPPSAEEFDETMRLYREGWDGDPATRKDYER